ncbi:MAG: ABC transporter ATP-binding protein, partial [Acidimicrobiia bacterium]
MLATVLVVSGLIVVPPVITRELVDVALPQGDLSMLTWLGAGMVAVPLVNALVGLAQRYWSSRAGEGIIFDLRRELYEHLQSMSLRFFTATKTGELISRLNSDVVGAQQAITGTFVSILSNVVSVVVILIVMVQADLLLTVLAVSALPLFILPARRVGRLLRRVTEQQMEHNATMSAILQETFNVSGALLVKLFNRGGTESERFAVEAGAVRDLGVRRAMIGRWFFAGLGLISAVGTAVVWWVGGYLVITQPDRVTTGTLVMFAGLLAQLYGPLSAISNSRVEFATSLVSFERVFEILDLGTDLPEAPEPVELTDVRGAVEFDRVYFTYRSNQAEGLDAVRR